MGRDRARVPAPELRGRDKGVACNEGVRSDLPRVLTRVLNESGYTMLLTWLITGANAIAIAIYIRERHLVTSLAFASFLFVVGLIVAQEYTYPFSAFVVVCVLLLLLDGVRIKSGLALGLMLLLAVSTAVAVFIYEPHQVLAATLTFFAWPVFYYLARSRKRRVARRELQSGLVFLALADLVIASVLFLVGEDRQAIINHHPIGGGLAVGWLPWLALRTELRLKRLVVAVSIAGFGVSVLLSRIRGHMLLFFLPLAVATAYGCLRIRGPRKWIGALAVIATVCGAGFWLALSDSGMRVIENAVEFLRIGDSLGRRSIENEYVWRLVRYDPVHAVVGYGPGAPVGEILPVSALGIQAPEYSVYKIESGFAFHNVWTTILYSFGWIGMFLYGMFGVRLILDVLGARRLSTCNRVLLVSYVLAFLGVLWWRKTLFNGVLEMISLGLVLSASRSSGESGKRKGDG